MKVWVVSPLGTVSYLTSYFPEYVTQLDITTKPASALSIAFREEDSSGLWVVHFQELGGSNAIVVNSISISIVELLTHKRIGKL